MPATYDALYSLRSVQVLPGNIVVDVEQVTMQTKPHALVATYPVPIELWQTTAGDDLLNLIAAELERLASEHHVVAASPGQEVDLNNLVVDYVLLTVGLDRRAQQMPPLYGTVNVTTRDVYETAIADAFPGGGGGYVNVESACDAEYARLEAIS